MRKLLLASSLVLLVCTLVSAAPQSGRIDSISPSAARAGEQVTIKGIGFGGPIVRITVGGLPAQLLAATGNQVSFVVPKGVTPGPTTVSATNPGGHVGDIAFTFLEGILLPGNPAAPAIDATFDMPPVGVGPSEIENGVIMTRLDVRFAQGATLTQVNAALVLVEGGIVSMGKGLPFVTIAIPRPANLAALQQIAHNLSSTPGILWAFAAGESAPQVLPVAASSFADKQLLPTRFPAAWNAHHLAEQDCETRKVPVLVADDFLRGTPYLLPFGDEVPIFPVLPLDSSGNGIHGYDVTTTIAALFNDQSPTGANPFNQCLDIKGIQVAGLTPSQEIFRIVQSFPAGQKFILNYSRAFTGKCTSEFDFDGTKFIERCEDTSVGNIPGAYDRANWAEQWKKRTFNLWDQFLVTAAAGNFRGSAANPEGLAARIYPGLGIARYASVFNIATDSDQFFGWVLNTGLWQPTVADPPLIAGTDDAAKLEAQVILDGLDQVGRANNVLITGSTTAGATYLDLIESNFSNLNPDITAVGEQIPTVGVPTQGTSFSAPQLAGLASYLWLLSADLRNNRPSSATRRAILDNGRDFPLAGHVLDAYAAALSLDAAAEPAPSTAPVRLAILDLNNDGVFDDADISAFIGVLLDSNGKLVEPSSPDYSRFDLNGDGFTGGAKRTESFDLDRIHSTQYGATTYSPDVTQDIEGQTVQFDSNAVTDLQILCYYAYSPMYQGDSVARKSLLAGHCGIAVQPATVTLKAGQQQQFIATVPSGDSVAWTVSGGGTIDSRTGLFTAGNTPGTFKVRATDTRDSGQFGEATVTITAGANKVALLSRVCSIQVFGAFSFGNLLESKPCDNFLYSPGPPAPPPLYTPPNVSVSNSVAGGVLSYSAHYTETISTQEVETNSISGGQLDLLAHADATMVPAGTTTNPPLVLPFATSSVQLNVEDDGTYLLSVNGQISANFSFGSNQVFLIVDCNSPFFPSTTISLDEFSGGFATPISKPFSVTQLMSRSGTDPLSGQFLPGGCELRLHAEAEISANAVSPRTSQSEVSLTFTFQRMQ